MTLLFIVFIIALCIYEGRLMIKKKLKRELAVYIAFLIITFIFGIAYFSNPNEYSIAKTILGYLYQDYYK